MSNHKDVTLAGLRKKQNRAQTEVNKLRKLFKETESAEVAEQLATAESKLTDANNRLSKHRDTM
jgi:hypothetical protein